jgi:hypothetical protein
MKRRLLTVALTIYALLSLVVVWPVNLQPKIWNAPLTRLKKATQRFGIRSGMELFSGFEGHHAIRFLCLVLVSRVPTATSWEDVRDNADNCAIPDSFPLKRSDYDNYLLHLFQFKKPSSDVIQQKVLKAYCQSRGEAKLAGDEILFVGMFRTIRNYQNGALESQFDWIKGLDCRSNEVVSEQPVLNKLPPWMQQKLRLYGREI